MQLPVLCRGGGGHPASDGLREPKPARHFQGLEKHEGNSLITHTCVSVRAAVHLVPPPAQASFPPPPLGPARPVPPSALNLLLRPRGPGPTPGGAARAEGRPVGSSPARPFPGSVRTGRPAAPRLAGARRRPRCYGRRGRAQPSGWRGRSPPRGRLGWSEGGAVQHGPGRPTTRAGGGVTSGGGAATESTLPPQRHGHRDTANLQCHFRDATATSETWPQGHHKAPSCTSGTPPLSHHRVPTATSETPESHHRATTITLRPPWTCHRAATGSPLPIEPPRKHHHRPLLWSHCHQAATTPAEPPPTSLSGLPRSGCSAIPP